jgi:hypothetical protein
MTHAHAILFWVLAGLYVLIEWYLPRSKFIAANSVLEVVANALFQIPGVGALVKPLTTKNPGPVVILPALDEETVETAVVPVQEGTEPDKVSSGAGSGVAGGGK